MKHNYLKSLFLMLMMCVGMGAWGDEVTLSISSSFLENGNLNDNQSNSWAITSDGSYTSSNSYIQVGTNSKQVSYLKLSTSAYSTMNISKIQVWGTSKANTNVTAKVSIGGHQLGESSAYTIQNASSGGTEFVVNNTNGYKGEILIEISRPSSATGAIYFNKLVLTYSSAADTRTAVNMTAFSATPTTLIKGETTTTTITNDQNGWTPSYTYESSNTSVATVSNDGIIKAVAKGTATITATLNIANDDAKWKKGTTSSKTIDITVNNPSHTAKFYSNGTQVGSDLSVEEGETITFPANQSVDDVVFIGWTKTAIDGTSDNAPSNICSSATMGTEDVTYYAVFATQEGKPEAETKTQTLQYDTWTYSGSTTDKSSYRLFHSGSYIESASFDRSKLSKVIVYGGTFGGDSYNKLTIGDGTNTWKSVTVSGSSQTGKNTYTDGTALTGTGTIRITSNSGSASSNGVRISKVEIYTKEGGYTYSNYCTTVKAVTGVAIKTAPTTLAYCEGEKFNPEGLVVTLTYEDETTKDVTYSDATASKFTFEPALDAALSTSDDQIAITINGQTASQNISVRSVNIKYTISWMVNGEEAKSEQVYPNVPVSAPAVDPVYGKVFRGWVAEEIDGTTNDTPSFVNVTNLTISEDKVFYAVFATEEGIPETHNIITSETDDFPTSYAAAADYTLNGVTFNITQAYVNGEKTQWRAAGNSNGTGAMYNKDAMNLSKITLTYDNSDNYKNFTIKVGNSANPTSGTEITGIADANNNKVYVFDCSSENASYFVLTNGTNAGYLASIDITCGGATYSDYCTTITASEIAISSLKYATYFNAFAYKMPENVVGKIITVDENGTLKSEEAFVAGDVVPAKTALLLNGNEGNYTLTKTATAATKTANGNLLHGNLEAGLTTGGKDANAKYYKFANGKNGLGWYYGDKDTQNGSAFNIAANKAYLVIEPETVTEVKGFFAVEGDKEDAIKNVEDKTYNTKIFNLQGQRVYNAQKGIFIMNGKKVVR